MDGRGLIRGKGMKLTNHFYVMQNLTVRIHGVVLKHQDNFALPYLTQRTNFEA
jgi:hypothetical protein